MLKWKDGLLKLLDRVNPATSTLNKVVGLCSKLLHLFRGVEDVQTSLPLWPGSNGDHCESCELSSGIHILIMERSALQKCQPPPHPPPPAGRLWSIVHPVVRDESYLHFSFHCIYIHEPMLVVEESTSAGFIYDLSFQIIHHIITNGYVYAICNSNYSVWGNKTGTRCVGSHFMRQKLLLYLGLM